MSLLSFTTVESVFAPPAQFFTMSKNWRRTGVSKIMLDTPDFRSPSANASRTQVAEQPGVSSIGDFTFIYERAKKQAQALEFLIGQREGKEWLLRCDGEKEHAIELVRIRSVYRLRSRHQPLKHGLFPPGKPHPNLHRKTKNKPDLTNARGISRRVMKRWRTWPVGGLFVGPITNKNYSPALAGVLRII